MRTLLVVMLLLFLKYLKFHWNVPDVNDNSVLYFIGILLIVGLGFCVIQDYKEIAKNG